MLRQDTEIFTTYPVAACGGDRWRVSWSNIIAANGAISAAAVSNECFVTNGAL
jgi:hypothetical protein